MNERSTVRRVVRVAGALLLAGATVPLLASGVASAGQGGEVPKVKGGAQEKVTICHRTRATTNPYRPITVAVSAVDGQGGADHYGRHQGPVWQPGMPNGGTWGDIIPPVAGHHSGLNWTSEGQAVYENGCKATKPTHTQTPTEPTETQTPTETDTETATPTETETATATQTEEASVTATATTDETGGAQLPAGGQLAEGGDAGAAFVPGGALASTGSGPSAVTVLTAVLLMLLGAGLLAGPRLQSVVRAAAGRQH